MLLGSTTSVSGEQAAERGQERPVGRLVSMTSDLAAEDGDLVAKREQLDLLGPLGAGEDDCQLEQATDGEVGKRPQVASGFTTSHRGEGSRQALVRSEARGG